MKKLILFSVLLAALPALAQNVRYDAPFPSISSTTTTPYLVANVPPNSPTLAVCSYPANQVPCTNYITTYNSAGVACPNGAQDTPQPQPSDCQAEGDAEGNIGFWAPAGTYDYTVTVRGVSYGPFTVTLGSTATSDATEIQGVPVTAPITTTPGTSLVIDSTGTSFTSQTQYDVDSRSCGLPTDGTTDAYASLQACVYNNPGAHIRLWKTAAATGVCDYKISQSVFMLGGGQWLDGRASGATANQMVRLCTSQIGVTALVMTNQMCPACKVSNIHLVGMEGWQKATASTFVLPFGAGYPGFLWTTASASAGGTTITVNGTNEAWTTATDGKTVQLLGGGTTTGTVTVSTTANNYTATCTCTRAMIGQTIAIPGAFGGNTLYAHIIGLTGTNPPVTGNAYLDQKPTSTVSSVTGTLGYDYYGTISSHSSAASATVTPAVTTLVSGAPLYVGSTADGIRSVSVGATISDVAVLSFGRDGVSLANDLYPYLATGGASNLSDNVTVDHALIQLNRGSGIRCAGSDCNVNSFSNSTISQNQLWGIDDTGFLINSISDTNAATHHQDCTILPCPSTGGATGGFKNTTATWLDGVPYSTANAPPIYHTDGTCTDGSTTITLGSGTNGFTSGQADATNGSILVATNCGTGGAADLVTFITAFTSSTQVTVADAASCGGSCPGGGAAVIQVYPTVTITGAPLFDPAYVGHTILLQQAGADGQAMVTTIAKYYSTTKVGMNMAPTNRSRNQATTIYFGSSDYQQELNWQKAWDFSTGAITTGTTALTTTGANDLIPTGACNATANLRVQFVIKGAGPGGIDHNATCSSTLSSPAAAATISTAASTTVSNAHVYISADGGPYNYRSGFCRNCYEEIDQFLHTHKFGTVSASPANVSGVPAAQGTSGFNYSPFASRLGLTGNLAIGTLSENSNAIELYAGRNKLQQIDVDFCDIQANNSSTCTKNARWTVNTAKRVQFYVGEVLLFDFVPGGVRTIEGDTAITSSGASVQINVGSPTHKAGSWNGDGSLTFNCSSTGTNCTTFSTSINTSARAIQWPDAAGTVALTTSQSPVYNGTGTQRTSAHIVEDTGTLSSGTPSTATVTLTGSSVFTSNATYRCSVTNQTTAANGLSIAYTNGSTFVVTGPNTVTDSFSYVCAGN